MSDWSINEAIWTAEKKVRENKISNREAFVIINLIADTVSDCIQDGVIVWLGFPERAVVESRVVIEEIRCNAADALHVYFAATSGCDYFVSADEDLILQVSFGSLRMETVYLHSPIDMNKFFNEVEN